MSNSNLRENLRTGNTVRTRYFVFPLFMSRIFSALFICWRPHAAVPRRVFRGMLPKSAFVSKCMCGNPCLLLHPSQDVYVTALCLHTYPSSLYYSARTRQNLKERGVQDFSVKMIPRDFLSYFVMQTCFQMNICYQMLHIHSILKINDKFRENICTFRMFVYTTILPYFIIRSQLCFSDEAMANTD